uniref:Lipoprotein n=1 Tax=Glossina pallidipes TaxID=7398 RepID=A0A1B0A3V1_GLOPL
MKVILSNFVLIAVMMALGVCLPQQREGAAYTNEAIRQAQQTLLIPKDAQIQNVQEGIELGAYEQIPGNQRINLFEILGDQVPSECENLFNLPSVHDYDNSTSVASKITIKRQNTAQFYILGLKVKITTQVGERNQEKVVNINMNSFSPI